MPKNVVSSRNDETKNNNKKLEGSNAMMNETENSCNNAAKNSEDEKNKKLKNNKVENATHKVKVTRDGIDFIIYIILGIITAINNKSAFYLNIYYFPELDKETNQKLLQICKNFGQELDDIISYINYTLIKLEGEVVEEKEEWSLEKINELRDVFINLPGRVKEKIDDFLKIIQRDDTTHFFIFDALKKDLYEMLKSCKSGSEFIVRKINEFNP